MSRTSGLTGDGRPGRVKLSGENGLRTAAT
jgi:hypothetical protein